MDEERRDWWNLGLNPITGLKAEPQESYFEAEKRYYQPACKYANKFKDNV